MKSLIDEMGRKPRFARIRIGADEIEFRVQGENRARNLNTSSVSLFDYLFFDRDWVSGPRAVQPDGIVENIASGFFDLQDLAVDEVAEVGRRALERAALQDPATITWIVMRATSRSSPSPLTATCAGASRA